MIICFIYNLNACLSIFGSYYEFNYLVFLILGDCVAVPPSSALRVSIILAVFLICTCTTVIVLCICTAKMPVLIFQCQQNSTEFRVSSTLNRVKITHRELIPEKCWCGFQSLLHFNTVGVKLDHTFISCGASHFRIFGRHFFLLLR